MSPVSFLLLALGLDLCGFFGAQLKPIIIATRTDEKLPVLQRHCMCHAAV
ncbi:MAG: Uncharacterised protein [Hyphomonas sp. TMED17]|nr:MAG: Uncharacterised protein [Hyphomonas sp. TMED17]